MSTTCLKLREHWGRRAGENARPEGGKSAVYVMPSSGQHTATTLPSSQQPWLSADQYGYLQINMAICRSIWLSPADQSSQESSMDRRGSWGSTHSWRAIGNWWRLGVEVWRCGHCRLPMIHTPRIMKNALTVFRGLQKTKMRIWRQWREWAWGFGSTDMKLSSERQKNS